MSYEGARKVQLHQLHSSFWKEIYWGQTPAGSALRTFWVLGSANGNGIDFQNFDARNRIDFHDFDTRNGIDLLEFR